MSIGLPRPSPREPVRRPLRPGSARYVLHVDLDQFIVAAELLRRPDLRGRPVVVGDAGDLTRRGVVAGASYEARRFGIHSAMPLRRAAARCPELVCLPLDFERYQAASATVMATLRSFPGVVVQVAGWDEAFIDVETTDPEGLARGLQAAVRAGTELSCSVGIGDNKLQAKTATELAKPGGVARLSSASWPACMGPRPPQELPGIGSKTAHRLAEHGIRTVGELAGADRTLLASVFGPVAGPRLRLVARGKDRSPVSAVPRRARSQSRAVTFQRDLDDPAAVRAAVRGLAAQVAREVAAEGRRAVRLVVTVRFAPFETHTHGTALEPRPGAFERAAAAALGRFVLDRPVRLVGVRAELDPAEAQPAAPRDDASAGSGRRRRPATAADSADREARAPVVPARPVIRAGMAAAPRRSLAEVAAGHGVTDHRLLEAMRAVPRTRFIPPELAALATDDVPVPIGHDQVTTQPSLVAAMVEALAVGPDDTVLEVGTGFGYQTALLSRLARHVWSIEWWPDLADAARANLSAAGVTNAAVVTGDGSVGLAEHAPYVAIVVSAAFPAVPRPLVEQLAPGGRLVQPVGPGGQEEVTLFAKEGTELVRRRLVTFAYFVRLVGAHGFGGARPEAGDAPTPEALSGARRRGRGARVAGPRRGA